MLKVLHTNAGQSWSGIEQRIFTIAKLLNSKDMKISLAISPRSPLVRKARENNLEVFPLNIRNKGDLKAVLKLKDILSRNHFSILHAHRSTDHWLAVETTKFFHLPVKIVRTRHSFIPISNNFFNRLLYKKWTKKIVTVAKIIKDDLMENNGIQPSKIVAIHSSLMLERFNFSTKGEKTRAGLKIKEGTLLVGMVGKLSKHKDYPNFLRAGKIIQAEIPAAQFLIVGEGPEEEKLKDLSKDLGIESSVSFLGYREDIPEILAALDVFVLSSELEGSPAVIKEAMALRKPVVATGVGGIPEIVEDGVTGFLVPSHNSELLAKGVLDIWRNREKGEMMGQKGKKMIDKRFTPERLASQTENLYRSM